MKLSSISNQTLAGKVLRLPLRLVPGSARVPILKGRLRGAKWIVGSSGNNGCWLGSYEYEQRLAFEKLIGVGSVVFDVGAHVGFYTLLSSRLVGPLGEVIAFEPLPRNLHYLREHLRLNRVENVRIIERALSDAEGEASFTEGENSFNARISEEGKIKVKTAALDHLMESEGLPVPDFIKMDIEGAETMALRGARRTLEAHHPTIFLTTHGPDIHEDCVALLKDLGYSLIFLDEGNGKGISRKIVARYEGPGSRSIQAGSL
jgi:FkbM family methyltransferase